MSRAASGVRRLVIALTVSALALPLTAAGTPSPGASSANPTPSNTVPITGQLAVELQTTAVDEKLARDVYGVLATAYAQPIFDNTAKSEGQHLTALRAVMARHAVADGTAGDAAGSFDTATVAALYTQLITKGKGSLLAALEVGVWVERFLIDQWSAVLAFANLPNDVHNVATNLRAAERLHLAAFEQLLSKVASNGATPNPPATDTATSASAAVRLRQRAQFATPAVGRYQVGTRLMLALQPVKTSSGATLRWIVNSASRTRCAVRVQDGRTTLALLKPGTCTIVAYAPPTPKYLAFQWTRTYRIVAATG